MNTGTFSRHPLSGALDSFPVSVRVGVVVASLQVWSHLLMHRSHAFRKID